MLSAHTHMDIYQTFTFFSIFPFATVNLFTAKYLFIHLIYFEFCIF